MASMITVRPSDAREASRGKCDGDLVLIAFLNSSYSMKPVLSSLMESNTASISFLGTLYPSAATALRSSFLSRCLLSKEGKNGASAARDTDDDDAVRRHTGRRPRGEGCAER